MSKNGCLYVPARDASVNIPLDGGLVTTKMPISAASFCISGAEVPDM